MKVHSGELMKKLRAEAGLSQEEMAEKLFISVRQLRRYESGEGEINLWTFLQFCEILGMPTEEWWIFYFNTEEDKHYRMSKQIKRLVRDEDYKAAEELLAVFEKSPLSTALNVQQFIIETKVKINPSLPPQEAIETLTKAIQMSNSKFDESKVAEYRLTYNEINILISLAGKYSKMGDLDRAIALTKAIIAGREASNTTEEDRGHVFPALMSNLSTMLGKAGRYEESLEVSEQGIKICRKYGRLNHISVLLYNTACSLQALGEEEHVYKVLLVRAYNFAFAIGDFKGGNIIKKDAENSFGILLD